MVKGYVGDGHYRVNIGVGAATIDAHESKLTAISDLPTGTLSTGRAESSSTSSENDDLARLALSGSAHTSPGQARRAAAGGWITRASCASATW